MNIRIKRIYEPPCASDGTRVLVDRVWSRGMTKEAAALTAWIKDVAPSPWLHRWFHHDPMRWQEFMRRYRSELNASGAAVRRLLVLCADGPVTLVYAARDTEHNHARVLMEYLMTTDMARHPGASLGTGARDGRPQAHG